MPETALRGGAFRDHLLQQSGVNFFNNRSGLYCYLPSLALLPSLLHLTFRLADSWN
jgi:hypothetical protein